MLGGKVSSDAAMLMRSSLYKTLALYKNIK